MLDNFINVPQKLPPVPVSKPRCNIGLPFYTVMLLSKFAFLFMISVVAIMHIFASLSFCPECRSLSVICDRNSDM